MNINPILRKHLQISVPVIQAPMAGGGDTAELVAATSNAGAIGFVGAAYLNPSQITERAKAIRALTKRPFGINLFAPTETPQVPSDFEAAIEQVAPFFAEVGLPRPETLKMPTDTFPEQLEAALDSGASAFSFTFGILPADAIREIKARGMLLIGTATTVREAQELETAGVDAIVAQGAEAGGHRGTFAADVETGMIGTFALVPQVVDAVSVPVIASGGIMDGRGIAAALALGAAAVQLGTAFLTCDEAGVPDCYKEKILHSREDQTRITRAFSGRPARGIINRFMAEAGSAGNADAILPFPLQNTLTRPMRTAAAQQGRAEFLSLWAGQGVRMARRQPAAELVRRLAEETEEAIRRLENMRQRSSRTDAA